MAGILVIAEHFSGKLTSISREMVSIAVELKKGLGGGVSVAVLTDGTEELASQANLEGVDVIFNVNIGSIHFDAMCYEAAIVQLGLQCRPSALLFGHTANGMACAAAVATRLGTGYASDVIAVQVAAGELLATKTAFGGKVNLELAFPNKEAVVLTVRGATFRPSERLGTAKMVVIKPDLAVIAGRAQHSHYLEAPSADVDISKADVILSIGRGIQEPENIPRFIKLADKLGVTLGCSRPFADAGLIPKAHQVGQSGTVASGCKLYIAIGISGAVQHLYGMKHVDTIIAVNTDANAPIFNVATFGSTVDALEVASALELLLETPLS
jgi:electron transfer flavoprotein alpha subunit